MSSGRATRLVELTVREMSLSHNVAIASNAMALHAPQVWPTKIALSAMLVCVFSVTLGALLVGTAGAQSEGDVPAEARSEVSEPIIETMAVSIGQPQAEAYAQEGSVQRPMLVSLLVASAAMVLAGGVILSRRCTETAKY